MGIIKQLFWIFLFSLLGEGIALVLAEYLTIPGSVIGMLLLFLALHLQWLKMQQVEEVGTWLTDNMAIFFVPAGVGLMTNFDLLAEFWAQLLFIVVITVIIMMAVVGKLIEKVMNQDKIKSQRSEYE